MTNSVLRNTHTVACFEAAYEAVDVICHGADVSATLLEHLADWVLDVDRGMCICHEED